MSVGTKRRRLLARARAAFTNRVMLIDSRSMAAINDAITASDLKRLRALMTCEAPEDEQRDVQVVNGVAVIPVIGALQEENDYMTQYFGATSYQVIEQQIKSSANDTSVKAIVLFCNSPGGAAVGCKRVADVVRSLRGTKPIDAYVQGMCCSAMYWIASSCDAIKATPDSLIGSIGAIYTHYEASAAYKLEGYEISVFTNKESPKKAHGNPYQPLSQDAKETLQNFIDSFGSSFVSDVATNRGVSSETVVRDFGQGDSFIATDAKRRGLCDEIVPDLGAVLASLSGVKHAGAVTGPADGPMMSKQAPTVRSEATLLGVPKVKKIKAMLFAKGLLDSIEASDEVAKIALGAFAAARGVAVPEAEAEQLKLLESPVAPNATNPVQAAHNREQAEARAEASKSHTSVADLQASAQLFNLAAGSEKITASMVLEAASAGQSPAEAVKAWNAKLGAEKSVATTRVLSQSDNSDKFAEHAVEALLYRATSQPGSHRRRNGQAAAKLATPTLSDAAAELANRPLYAIAAQALELAGQKVDLYGDRELICRSAMEMGQPGQRHAFYSHHEGRQFISASGGGYNRPGDFPNILSGLANKFLDSIELDEWTYPEWSAVWPTGFGDFKPSTMVNHGTADELDEVLDSQSFTELKKAEEVLSYIFCRRFGNKWGWTPVMLANDDLGAFAEGMLGLDEAWETTQHRLCLQLITSNPTLLDGSALFASRTQGNNDRTSGAAPSDSEWAAMETLYADIKGVGATTRRVRGSLNTLLSPTGTQYQEARRTFMPLNAGGVESKAAATTSNVGLYRGMIDVIPEPELRDDTVATRYYGLRSPTQLRTATIVRGYFNGFGAGGRREHWYDSENKKTWISNGGRIGVAVKNWRYIVRNKGAV